MTVTDRILAHLAAVPDASAVDLHLARVDPRMIGTAALLEPLRTLAATGQIIPAPSPLDPWREHVDRFPRAHPGGTELFASQAARWRLP